ncbi:hypothetical protein [Flavobacterium sp. UMI-01]|nr:hypothetical protein [Flavobacterium sp. UMI-01]
MRSKTVQVVCLRPVLASEVELKAVLEMENRGGLEQFRRAFVVFN